MPSLTRRQLSGESRLDPDADEGFVASRGGGYLGDPGLEVHTPKLVQFPKKLPFPTN